MNRFGGVFFLMTAVVFTATTGCGLQMERERGLSYQGIPIVEGDLSGCGDDICVADVEFWETCPADCPYEGYCGDSVCDADEIAGTCPGDCSEEPDECDFRGQRICAEDGSLLVCVWRAGDVGALNYARLTCADGETCSDGECVEIPSECGDGTCDQDEDCSSCEADCGCADGETCSDGECVEIPSECGDGTCDQDETCASCPADCVCADGETCFEEECVDHYCTDGECNEDEDEESCPDDCAPFCGDGTCHLETEDCGSCPEDCGCADGQTCTDGVCLADPTCGDGECNGDEDCSTCEEDCGCADGEECVDGVCEEPEPVCGDGECNGDESCDTCDYDCGGCLETCGDGTCGYGEWCDNCPEDCGECDPFCGDGFCDPDYESPATCGCDCRLIDNECMRLDRVCGERDDAYRICILDRGVGAFVWVDLYCPMGFMCVDGGCLPEPECGDGSCEDLTEDCGSCPLDCGECPDVCGDDICQDSEDCDSCEADCGECPYCGNGYCDPGEDVDDCAYRCVPDCGPCDPVCGDGSCDPGEDCDSCEADCGECPYCGDEDCNPDEDCDNCPDDCGECPPPEGVIDCVWTSDGLEVTISGPGPMIEDIPAGPLELQIGCDSCGDGYGAWSVPYGDADPRPSVSWVGWDHDYVIILPPDADQFNFVLVNEITRRRSWFDIELGMNPEMWEVTGDCHWTPGEIVVDTP